MAPRFHRARLTHCRSLGATAIPATFLIGPDGRILAKDLRGEKTNTTVAEALKRYKKAK